jgi:hypothetical protein
VPSPSPWPRLLPSDLEPGERRVYRAALVFFLVVLAAVVWPVYALFADIRPLVLGMPLSLAWVVAWVVISFLGLLAIFLWESRGRNGEGRSRDGPR